MSKQFEYTEAWPPSFEEEQDLVAWMNERGSEGWELVHFEDKILAIFKREVEVS